VTALSARRTRLLRLRALQHQMACANLAAADARLVNLNDVAGRLAALRFTLAVEVSPSCGAALRTRYDMTDRLDVARAGLAQPLAEAALVQSECQRLRTQAWQKEESALHLRDAAVRSEAEALDRKSDANRPPIKRQYALGGEA
jgi:hypothetical protein